MITPSGGAQVDPNLGQLSSTGLKSLSWGIISNIYYGKSMEIQFFIIQTWGIIELYYVILV